MRCDGPHGHDVLLACNNRPDRMTEGSAEGVRTPVQRDRPYVRKVAFEVPTLAGAWHSRVAFTDFSHHHWPVLHREASKTVQLGKLGLSPREHPEKGCGTVAVGSAP